MGQSNMSDSEAESMSGDQSEDQSDTEITEPKKRKRRGGKIKFEDSKMTRAEYKRYIIKVKNKQKRERRKKVLEKYLNSSSKFHIKCRKPVEDEIFDVDEYVKYLKERFKMNGKTGCVGPKGLVYISKNVTTVYISSKNLI